MINIDTLPEVTHDPGGYRVRLREFSVIGSRYLTLHKRDDISWVQPGAAESWLDFCRQLKRVIDETSSWGEWDAKSLALDESHCSKFTRLVLNTQELRNSLQKNDAAPGCRDGLPEFLAEVFDTAKCYGAARGMRLEEFELTVPTSVDSNDRSYELRLADHEKSLDTLRWLINNQTLVVTLLKPAMCKAFEWMRDADPSDEIWFPTGDADQLAVDRFLLDTVAIHGNRITLSFETPSGHFEEHGCYAVIRDGVLEGFGDDLVFESLGPEEE